MGGPRQSCPRIHSIVANQGNPDACVPVFHRGTRMEYIGRPLLLIDSVRAVNMCIALATTKKNQLTVSDYYTKMCHFADEHAASGAPLHDEELVVYLLVGLDKDFNPVFIAMLARVYPITPSELYGQLLSFEHHTNLQAHTSLGGSSSAMAASRGCAFSGGRGPSGLSRGTGRSRGRGRSPSHGGFSNGKWIDSHTGSSSRPQCQLCLKIDHLAKTCWYWYEEVVTVD
jgi:hypothetical protein